MESYTLIFVRDQHARPVQIAVPKVRVKQAAIAAAAVVLFGAVLAWDYWRLRADNAELADLRVEAFEQREDIAAFRGRLVEVDQQIAKVAELERKVRIIANLPGTAGVGGEGVAELAPEGMEIETPAGVPIDPNQPMSGQGGGQPFPEIGDGVSGVDVLNALGSEALVLADGASNRADSLDFLLEQLADKRQRLISMPSIWPAKGWLTSRYGARVSPFTGKRQVHAGIDIAAASGTSIYAPARGRVTFSGRKFTSAPARPSSAARRSPLSEAPAAVRAPTSTTSWKWMARRPTPSTTSSTESETRTGKGSSTRVGTPAR